MTGNVSLLSSAFPIWSDGRRTSTSPYMEEPRAVQTTPPLSNSNPPPSSTAQTLPPNKKRTREYDVLRKSSNYIKMRAVVKDLRPHFIEVLKTSDFRNCKASHEIQEQLKNLMEAYKHMKADIISLKSSVPHSQTSSDGNWDGKKLQDTESHEESRTDRVFRKPYENSHSNGTYVVGGSAFGWNFITYKGKEPVYCGMTKEQFRSTKSFT